MSFQRADSTGGRLNPAATSHPRGKNNAALPPHIAALRGGNVGTVAKGWVHGGLGLGRVPTGYARSAHATPPPHSQCGRKENTMSLSETEIHHIVLRLLREGYAALTSTERKVVDSLMAVC